MSNSSISFYSLMKTPFNVPKNHNRTKVRFDVDLNTFCTNNTFTSNLVS